MRSKKKAAAWDTASKRGFETVSICMCLCGSTDAIPFRKRFICCTHAHATHHYTICLQQSTSWIIVSVLTGHTRRTASTQPPPVPAHSLPPYLWLKHLECHPPLLWWNLREGSPSFHIRAQTQPAPLLLLKQKRSSLTKETPTTGTAHGPLLKTYTRRHICRADAQIQTV